MDARAAVALLAGVERRAHQHLETAVPLRARRRRPVAPRRRTRWASPRRHAAQLADAEGGLLRGDQGELHCWCFAKKAAAFFRISRSSAARGFSLRSRASSSRSAVVSPVRPLVRSARARFTHSRNGDLGQIQVAGHGRDALALVEHQPDGLGFEVVIKLPARAPALGGVCHRSGHRIHLSEDVHQTGSSPTVTGAARRLSLWTAGVLAVQAGGGLLVPGLYRDNPWIVSVYRGTDTNALLIDVPGRGRRLSGSRRRANRRRTGRA